MSTNCILISKCLFNLKQWDDILCNSPPEGLRALKSTDSGHRTHNWVDSLDSRLTLNSYSWDWLVGKKNCKPFVLWAVLKRNYFHTEIIVKDNSRVYISSRERFPNDACIIRGHVLDIYAKFSGKSQLNFKKTARWNANIVKF